MARLLTTSFILLIVYTALSLAAECPSNSLRDKSADFARALASKGFELTDYDMYINRPVLTKEETCIKPTPEEAVACNEAFRTTYRAGLLKSGKTEADVDEWFGKVLNRGELVAPYRACDN